MAFEREIDVGKPISDTDALLKEAIRTIRDLKRRLSEKRSDAREPVAIVGMSCRFPGGADDPEKYFDLLDSRRDPVLEVPPERWHASEGARHAALLDDIRGFDAAFFEMSAAEAERTDPQHRLALEVALHALEDAGMSRERLRGSSTGVFLAICNSDHWHHEITDLDGIGPYSVGGSLPSMAANRISYHFDLRGPSLTVDTACSSSLVALELAVQHLRNETCDVALVGGVNLLLSPGPAIAYDRLGASSASGRCRAFDADADGFVRGEGCAFLVLKRLPDAERSGDRIAALIRGSAVNQDGRSAGPMAPNPAAQAFVLRAALADARLEPADVDHVEAHGTGTPLGDPIEMEALKEVYGARGDATPACIVGAAKTHIGHLEAAAGMAGIIKVVMSMRRERIPAMLHFRAPNPHLGIDASGIELASRARPWPRGGRTRRAGVSSFGIGGTNAHVILEEPPARDDRQVPDLSGGAPKAAEPLLVILSARSESALRRSAADLADHVAEGVHPAAAAAELALGRSRYEERAALVVHDELEWIDGLRRVAHGEKARGVLRGAPGRAGARVAFVFSGQGVANADVITRLASAMPEVRAALHECEHALGDSGLLTGALEGTTALGDLPARAAQTILFAVGAGLLRAVRSLGLEPALVAGHSLGELVAAHAAGVLTLDDGARLVAARGEACDRFAPRGAMASLPLPEGELRSHALVSSGRVQVAIENGARETVVGGSAEDITRLLDDLDRAGARGHRLSVGHAFHTPALEGAADALESALAPVDWRRPTVPMIESVGATDRRDATGWPELWRRQLVTTLRFRSVLDRIAEAGVTHIVEIGPTSGISALARSHFGVSGPAVVPLARGGGDPRADFLRAIARLFVDGATIDPSSLFAGHSRPPRSLPPYPFDRRPVPSRISSRPAPAPSSPPAAARAVPLGPEPVVSAEARIRATLGDILSGAGLDPNGAASVPADADLRGHLGLDSLAMIELKDRVERDVPGVAIPLRALLQGASIEALVRRLESRRVEDAESIGQPSRDATPSGSMSAEVRRGLEAFASRRAEGPFDRRLVHKSHDENVLLSRLEPDADGVIFGEIIHHLEHPFFYEHRKDHVPSIYLIEAAKQFITAAGHVVLGVPLDRPFAVEGIDMRFRRFAEISRPLFLVGRFGDAMRDGGEVEYVVHRLWVVQDARVIAEGRCSLHGFAREEYAAARRDGAVVDDWSK